MLVQVRLPHRSAMALLDVPVGSSGDGIGAVGFSLVARCVLRLDAPDGQDVFIGVEPHPVAHVGVEPHVGPALGALCDDSALVPYRVMNLICDAHCN